MQSNNRLFEDAAKLAGGALGTLTGIRREMEALARQQLERVLARMDLVSREEFEVVRAMAAKARSENEELAARIEALESKAAKPVARAKPASKAKP